jgi:hypothetical protein
MKKTAYLGVLVLVAGVACGGAQSLAAAPSGADSATVDLSNHPASGPMAVEWTPPALAGLTAEASSKTSFTLDRSMLTAASALLPDSEKEARQAIAKIDGISVRLLRFEPAGIGDESSVEQVRAAYHQRGWKHLVSTTATNRSSVQNGSTDLWMALDGSNVHGAVLLVETPKSLTLVTLAGNLSTLDLLHLRGHFGIPRFESDGFKDERNK